MAEVPRLRRWSLRFSTPHKSITGPVTNDGLPGLVVVTGLNGAGKSHLLEAIATGAVELHVDRHPDPLPRYLPGGASPFRYIAPGQLRPSSTGPQSSANYRERWTYVASLIRQAQESVARDTLNARHGTPNERVRSAVLQSGVMSASQLDALAGSAGKAVVDLTEDDIRAHCPLLINVPDVLALDVTEIFLAYRELRERNDYERWRYTERGGRFPGLSDEEFERRYGPPPWDVVNETLEKLGLDYVVAPVVGVEEAITYEPMLTHRETGITIGFGDLSAGERVLMAIAMSLYGTENFVDMVGMPSALLLDEPDASLHPQMASTLLHLLEDVFCRRGVFVMLATHSPSTVVLAPEESIFVMSRAGDSRLRHVARDAALRGLMAGVPALSVSADNRRQVFVESEVDEAVYTDLYSLLRPFLGSELSLAFIASGRGGGGSAQAVSALVRQLREAGNHFVWGIVDRDSRQGAPSFIAFDEERYSIENIVLDPFVLGAFLLRERHVTPASMGLAADVVAHSLDESQAQQVTDYVVAQVTQEEGEDATPVEVRYVNGFAVNVPRFWLDVRGRDLERRLNSAFPMLRRYDKNLMGAIVDRTLRDSAGGYVPQAVLRMFQEVLRRADAG